MLFRSKVPMAAISEDLRRTSVSAEEKSAKYKVIAVVTVKNKIKEDLKDTFMKQFDALTDKIGMNIVLQLISTEIDPSKIFYFIFHIFTFWVCLKNELFWLNSFWILCLFIRNKGSKEE